MSAEFILFGSDRSIRTVSEVEGFENELLEEFQRIYMETASLNEYHRPVIASTRVGRLGFGLVKGWFTTDTPIKNFLAQKWGHHWNTYQGREVDLTGDRFRGRLKIPAPEGIWIVEKGSIISGHYVHPESLTFPPRIEVRRQVPYLKLVGRSQRRAF